MISVALPNGTELPLPTKHLRVGQQDITVRAPGLGYVTVSINYRPTGAVKSDAAAAAARREADAQKAQRDAAPKTQQDVIAMAQREAAVKAQREADANAQREADARARREEVAAARAAEEAAARREAEAKRAAEERARREADEKAASRKAEEQAQSFMEEQRLKREAMRRDAEAQAAAEKSASRSPEKEAVPPPAADAEATGGDDSAAPSEEDDDEEEGESDDGPLAEIEGDLCLGSSLNVAVPDDLLPDGATPSGLSYQWHRSHDGESWQPIAGAEAARLVLGAEDVGCWLFCEWRYADGGGAAGARAKAEGSTEASEAAVRLLPEDRDDLKAATLAGTFTTPVKTSEGGATLTVSRDGVRLAHRFGGTRTEKLATGLLRTDASDPLTLWLTADGVGGDANAKQLKVTFETQQSRDLAALTAECLVSLDKDAAFDAPCQVWEGDEYGPYHGRLHGEVLLLFEGSDAPPEGEEPTEAILLHGCHTEDVDGDDGAFELSIADADGETFSLNFEQEEERSAWREAIEGRSAPPAIAHAAHILIKHRGSRRLASWRDPDGTKIKLRSQEEATQMLQGFRREIKAGRRSIEQIAEEASDCDTATHGGDLGWFAAGYMQPEFEEATLALAVGELSDVVTTASGCHLILRVG